MPRNITFPLLAGLFLFIARTGSAQTPDGKSLFQSNCAQCHNPVSVVVGPALKGVTQRVPDQKLLHAWIRNNSAVLASGNTYFNNLFNQYGRAPMNVFPGLGDPEIDAILQYVENYAQPLAATNTSNFPNASQEDHSVLFGICTFVLALFAFGLYLINTNLKRLADDKRNLPRAPRIPVYRNKFYIAIAALLIMGVTGWWLTEAGVGLGRQQGYQPQQPIFFSHRVHAGLNQISCLLCHGNAWESKQASVPSLNFCMNCHAAITVYHGERLTRPDGSNVDPNQEIQKLFDYTGYDPAKGRYTREGRPVQWTRIHNLPDHVFFSHAQHVHAGKVQCQTCHGPIQKMDEVYQFAPLSMGWCINCHRTTKVDFAGNKFYSIYSKFHDRDSVTVENIGGTECQKCHY
jgi:mono/diheme cytochrome c family protein